MVSNTNHAVITTKTRKHWHYGDYKNEFVLCNCVETHGKQSFSLEHLPYQWRRL